MCWISKQLLFPRQTMKRWTCVVHSTAYYMALAESLSSIARRSLGKKSSEPWVCTTSLRLD
jgi:hypothetical protein